MKKIILQISLLVAVFLPNLAIADEEIFGIVEGENFKVPCSYITHKENSLGYFQRWLASVPSYTGGTDYTLGSISGGGAGTLEYCQEDLNGFYNFDMSGPSGVYPTGDYYMVLTIRDEFDVKENFYIPVHWNGVFVESGNLLDNTETEIISFDPPFREVRATSTDFYFEVDTFITTEDYDTDMFLRLKYVRQLDLQSAVANQDLLWTTINFPSLDEGGGVGQVITDGYSFISTTSPVIEPGLYLIEAEIRKSSLVGSFLGWFGLDNFYDSGLVIASSSQFIASTTTAFDNLIINSEEAHNAFFASSTLSLADIKNYCSFSTSFSIVDCLEFFFGYQPGPMSLAMDNMKEGFFAYAPFGYITRFVDIMTDQATTTIPALSYTFPADGPVLAGETFAFDPWPYFYVAGSPLKDEIETNDGEHKDIWEVAEPLFKVVVGLSLLFLIIHDLTDIHSAVRGGEGSVKQRTL